MADTTVVVSVDTEEDDWASHPRTSTTDHIRELPRVHAFLEGLGLRPTYFTTYCVVTQPSSAAIVAEIAASGHAEIGAHLHPWNTPPFGASPAAGSSMLWNLPVEVQRAKLRTLTTSMVERLTSVPRSFRAGRFGFGPSTAALLIESGYEADSSVTPYFSWERYDAGPSFVGAPNRVYLIDGGGDVRVPSHVGRLTEVPISCGYTRLPDRWWPVLHALVDGGVARSLKLTGAASRLGLARRIMLTPEQESVGDMFALARRLIAGGAEFLHLFWHSSTLRPGLNPFAATRGDVERLYGRIAGLMDRLAGITALRAATVGEAAATLEPRSHGQPGR